jgi:hypothetical protein
MLARQAIEKVPPFGDATGRGIVICAGGERLFTNAWVCVHMLRRWGCRLPIQVWYLGDCEFDRHMGGLLAGLDVEPIDAERVAQDHPVRTLRGWELKAFALLRCSFREVLLLDADNVPVRDPTFLFETPEFAQHGAIFWPDFGRLDKSRSIWEICEVPFRDEPEFETGQAVIDRARCWLALWLAMHYNEHSDFYYQHIHGDKDTFHLAFRRVNKSYAMPPWGINALDATMCQHDFDGQRTFQHRNMDKWRLDGRNRRISGFLYEDECRAYLADLKARWSGRIHWNEELSPAELQWIREVSRKRFIYERVGYDRRPMKFREDRTIGEGAAGCERLWTIALEGEQPQLFIYGDDTITCRLRGSSRNWSGRWYRHERMPILLRPADD